MHHLGWCMSFNADCLSADLFPATSSLHTSLLARHCLEWFVYLFWRNNFKGLIKQIYYGEISLMEPPQHFTWVSTFKGLVHYADHHPLYCDLFACRYMEQLSSFMNLTQRRTCLSVSTHNLACQALIPDQMGPGVFTATRASACSPTGPSSNPSGVFSLSSTDTPSLDHTPCLLKS